MSGAGKSRAPSLFWGFWDMPLTLLWESHFQETGDTGKPVFQLGGGYLSSVQGGGGGRVGLPTSSQGVHRRVSRSSPTCSPFLSAQHDCGKVCAQGWRRAGVRGQKESPWLYLGPPRAGPLLLRVPTPLPGPQFLLLAAWG